MQRQPEGTQGSQLCCKGITGGVRCHSHLHPHTADMDTELFQTPDTDHAKHPEDTQSAHLNASTLSQEKPEAPAESKTKVIISLNQINCSRCVTLLYSIFYIL